MVISKEQRAWGLAAERILLAAATLLRNTVRRKPIQAKRHLGRMLREVPGLCETLGTAANGRLERQVRKLAEAYQVGDAEGAKEASRTIEVYLYTLCH